MPLIKKPKPSRVSRKLVITTRTRLGLTIDDFATALGVHPATVYRWEAEPKVVIRATVARLILCLSERTDADLQHLGAAVIKTCLAGKPIAASRLLFDAATKGA